MVSKVIVITGVSSGIGKAFVLHALKNIGQEDVIVGLGRSTIEELDDGHFFFIKTDLRNGISVKNAIQNIKKRFGHIDVLINNAGLGYRGTIEDLSMDEIRDQFEVNFFGLIYLTQLVLPMMRIRKFGQIINVSSVSSFISTPTLGYYGATKAALDKISEVLARELEKYGIKIGIFIPGAVKTGFGKNIRLARRSSKSAYFKLYKEWELRFSYFFKKRNTSEEAAEKLWNLVESQEQMEFVDLRDKIIYLFKKILPERLFNFLISNYYYKYEN